jgi:nardilysin
MSDHIIISPSDHRTYKALQLPNGLRAILIRDPQIEAASTISDLKPDGSQAPSHKELVDDNASMGEEDGSSESEEGSSDSGRDSFVSEDEEEHEHVRPHHPRNGSHSSTKSGGVKKAAAALSVGIGHFSDPKHLPGLSHYLEHMLFMGSEKYPDENDYDAFLSSNSGSSNACTEEESTTYHFDCAPGALEGALDRFAQFFVAPLIKADALEREVQAVDNEFSGVLQNDSCRHLQIRSFSSKENHPMRNFGWGNRKSLAEDPKKAGIDIRSELLKHYKEHYSAERMNLVVLGGETLETMENWVVEKFTKVPSGKGPRPNFTAHGVPFDGPPFGGDFTGFVSEGTDSNGTKKSNTTSHICSFQNSLITILPSIRDEHRITVTFPFPCLQTEYTKKAEDYLSHFIGHEGKGSLLADLKASGWATDLCAGVSEQTSASYLFDVSITLTEAGLEADPGCGLAVVDSLFHYLSMLRAAQPQRWAWEEMATIAEMRWNFLEEEDAAEYTAQIASDMHMYPVQHTLQGMYLHEKFDPNLINTLLHQMTTTALRIDVQTKNYEACCQRVAEIVVECSENEGVEDGGKEKADKKGTKKKKKGNNHVKNDDAPKSIMIEKGEEPWFGIPFVTTIVPSKMIKNWSLDESERDSTQGNLYLPPPNPYLASDFNLKCEQQPQQEKNEMLSVEATPAPFSTSSSAFPSPSRHVYTTKGLSVWHKMDSTFNIPRTNAYFKLSLPAAYCTPRSSAMTHLVTKILEDSLCQEAYLADVASLHYNIWFEGYQGIDIKVDGFSHKLPLLATFIFKTIAALQFTDEDFTRIHEQLVRSYRNANMKPLKHANYLRLRLLKKEIWPLEALRSEMEIVTAADIRAFLPVLLKETHIESLIFGNVTEKEAISLGEAARAALGAVSTAILDDLCLHLPDPCCSWLLHAPVVNADEENSAIEVYFQCGPSHDPRRRALLDCVDQLVYEPCYDTLRTKEQLGYTVSSGPRLTHGISGFCVVVQSSVYGPLHLNSRVDVFLTGFLERLKNMDMPEFEKNRQALLANKLLKDRNLAEEAERAWDTITNRGQDFKLREEEVEAIKNLKHEEVVDFFEKVIAPGGLERRKLAVHIAGKAHLDDLKAENVPDGVVEVREIDEIKQKYGFYPEIKKYKMQK